MKHGQLFGGIFGFGLAAQWAGIENVWYNEIDKYCCDVVRARMADEQITDKVKIYEQDIRTIGKHNLEPVDIITGGFPCQPFSHAGKRKGPEDDRYEWPEMFRVVKELQPLWVVAENVYGIVNIDNWDTVKNICSSLESIGYERPIIFDNKADFTGLPTMERHVWIISKAIGKRCKRSKKEKNKNNRNKREFQGTDQRKYKRWDISKTKFCRVGERVSGKLDRNQRHRLKALGNAIVPQVAYEIFKAIIEFEAEQWG